MEHRITSETMGSHNVVIYVKPRDIYLPIDELWKDDSERALAENAVYFFIENPHWRDADTKRVKDMWNIRGVDMFIWKYYAAARCYLGGYKALSATLQLRKAR